MKIVLISICKNEEEMLPFFFRHYNRFVDEYFFVDNMSTDKSVEIIKSQANTHVIQFDSLGYQKEEINTFIRNQAYQRLPLKGDWYIIVDIDEYVCHSDLRKYLELCESKGITMPRVTGYNIFNETRPADDGNIQITEWCSTGLRNDHYSKFCVIHNSVDINFGFGSHSCAPKGNVKISDETELSLLHYNVHYFGDKEVAMKRKLGYKFSDKTNDLIPRGATQKFGRPMNREEGMKYRLPVTENKFNAKVHELMESSKQDDPEASFHIALIYLIGHIIPFNKEKAYNWLNRAVSLNHPLACFYLGIYYIKENDLKNALPLFIKGAELEQQDCLFLAGSWLNSDEASKECPDIVEQYKARAVSFLKKAADDGHGEACYEMLLHYSKTNENEKLSMEYLHKGAEKIDIISIYSLGAHYFNLKEFDEAYRWLKNSAERGYNDGYKVLDQMLEDNLGRPDDLDGALEWFQFKLKRALGPV